jgi:predicted HTH domain antitoxin
MTLTIPDDILQQAGLTEHEALVEFACRLFDAGRLPLAAAARLAALSRAEMEDELGRRGIAIYRVNVDTVKSKVRKKIREAVLSLEAMEAVERVSDDRRC